MGEVTITLPDGSSRQVPAGSTPADVAAAISPRLAKAAIAAIVDGRHVDLTFPLSRDAKVEILTDRGSRRAARLPAQHRPPAGGGRDAAVSRHPVRRRPGDRRRLLLRLRRPEAVRAGRPRSHRKEDEGAGVAGPGLRAPDVAAPGRDRLLHEARRAAQGPADSGEDRGPDTRSRSTPSRTATPSSTSASARTCPRPGG